MDKNQESKSNLWINGTTGRITNNSKTSWHQALLPKWYNTHDVKNGICVSSDAKPWSLFLALLIAYEFYIRSCSTDAWCAHHWKTFLGNVEDWRLGMERLFSL
jgi:hypothetical protein